MQISLAFTNYNRCGLLLEAFSQVVDDPRVLEIVISDDCSTNGSYEKLRDDFNGHPKVKVFQNEENLGMSRNKAKAISLCTQDWVGIFDSDNEFNRNYLTALHLVWQKGLDDKTFYMPCWAIPNFNYNAYAGLIINKENIKEYLDRPMFEQCLNTCNMVVPRKKYLEVYEHNPTVKEVDTLWMNYLWLKAGYSFYIVPGMTYFHLVHENSGWLSHAAENIKKGEEIKSLIRQL